ncbi:putative transposase, MuDR, plant, MULE transposase domain-containing protein [Helianthus annuus]|nr:putative transposase, MuDR, plant, MULE transposase domain-containing protein [Helianthus annuus]
MDDDGDDFSCCVRKEGVHFDPEVKYANHPDLFTLKVNHGGDFTDEDDFQYVGGKVDYVDNVSGDMFSINILLAFGYSENDVVVYHFRVPGEDLVLGLRPLGSDSDVLRLISYVEKNKVLEVYIQHVSRFSKEDVEKEPEYVDLSDEGSSEGSEQQDEDSEDSDQDEDSDWQSNDGSYEGSCEGSAGEGEKAEGVETTPSKRVKSFHRKSVKAKNRKDKVGQDEDDEDPDYIIDKDNIVEDYSVDMKEHYAEVDAEISEQNEQQVDVDEDDDQVDLDGFESLTDSEGDTALERACRSVRKDKRKSKTSVECPFYIGQSFPDKGSIKMLVKNHAIETRRQLHITRNDNTRFRVICMGGIPKLSSCEINAAFKGKSGNTQNASGPSQDGPNPKKNTPPTCPWMLYVSKVKKAGSWVVKTLNKEHVCLNTRDVRLCTVGWLSKKIQHTVKNNPGIPLKALQEDLQRKYQVEVTLHQVFRAKMKATEKVQGHYRAQYENLRNYCEELLRSNPGSTVKIDVEPCGNPSSPTRQFRRIYVCLGALKAGFKLIGRPILGLDGCFLKGPFHGQILTAVGVDGNNGIYPVAYAVVEAETTASWSWFLECLGDDLELEHNSNFTFITDRQKVTHFVTIVQ